MSRNKLISLIAVFILGYAAGSYLPFQKLLKHNPQSPLSLSHGINEKASLYKKQENSPAEKHLVTETTPDSIDRSFNCASNSMNSFEQTYKTTQTSQATTERKTIIECAQTFIQQNKLKDAISILTDYLQSTYDDPIAWRLKATAQKMLLDNPGYIESLLNYAKYETDPHKTLQTIEKLKPLLLKQHREVNVASYSDNQTVTTLIQQLENLATLLPADTDIAWALAQLWQSQNNIDQTRYYALISMNDPAKRNVSKTLLDNLELNSIHKESETDDLLIPLERHRNQFIIKANIDNTDVRLLIDTGASLSGISTEFADKHLDLIGNTDKVVFSTAAGEALGKIFTAKELIVGDATFQTQRLAIFPMQAGQDFDGLLGVDILGQFEFYIDQTGPWLYLQRK